MANYPTSAFSPTTKNAGDTIAASHVNDLQAEVTAIETALLTSGLAHHLLFVDATYDIGASGATRPRHLYLSGNVTCAQVISSANAAGANGASFANTSATGYGVAMQGGGSDAAHYLLNVATSLGVNRLTLSGTGLLTLSGHSASTPTFVAGDKYLVIDANGNVHVSATGPAS